MQQRRGTSTQWTNADPVLAAGEIGVETDTNQFKIGDGVSVWSDLSYFQNLGDLGASLDDYVLLSTKGVANGVATLDSSGYIPMSQFGNILAGAPEALNTLNELAAAIDNNASFASSIITSLSSKISMTELNTHSNNTINVHGIANTANLATTAATGTAISNAVAAETAARGTAINTAIDTAAATATTKANLAESNAKTYAASYADGIGTTAATNLSTHNSATTGVHGITDTANLATKTYADTAVSTHAAVTTSVHGIADTSALALTATVNSGLALKANLASPTFTGTVTLPNSTISTAMIADSAITSAKIADGTIVAGDIADGAITSAKILDGTIIDADVSSSAAIATSKISGLDTALSAKAPLASPALTGTPTAPTATAGTATTQIATTAFVGTAVSNLVASAPAALDTLNELATALGNDASFSTTVTNSLAAKAPLASPTFTGTVTLPATGIVFSDGTQSKEGVPSRTPIVAKTASYTLSALTERDSVVEVNSASAVTLTVPLNATIAYPVGTSIDVLQTGAGQITVAGAAGVTVNATPGLKLRTQWSGATLFKRATDTWVLYGDLSA